MKNTWDNTNNMLKIKKKMDLELRVGLHCEMI